MNRISTSFSFLKSKTLLGLLFLAFGYSAYGQMYGDTIFWENFGTGASRADLSGRGQVGTSYKYEGPVTYVYALNSSVLSTFVDNNLGTYDFVIDAPKFQEVPMVASATPYTYKPTTNPDTTLTPQARYWKVTAWATMTLSSSSYTDYTTATYPANNSLTTANYPCAWVRVPKTNGGYEWKFGFYYVTYTNYSYSPIVPNDGYYALIHNTNYFKNPAAQDYLQNNWVDHSGLSNLSSSPLKPDTITHSGNGRMLFVNCSQNTSISGAVYKRQVNELCRGAEFEFSVWLASIHKSNNNSHFRIEIWSDDPGNNPSLGAVDSSYIGQTVAIANEAKLITISPKLNPASLGVWYKLTEHFVLTGQDYCWVVVRNYGSGTGNDIVIDDLVFRPYAPFNLDVSLVTETGGFTCTDGLVTLVSTFPSSLPEYIDVTQYGFYFQGYRNGTWTRVGSATPIQTQSATTPLELTLPIAEYNLYSQYRVTVATTPAGFGGKCVTFTYPPTPANPIPDAPNFILSGNDVCMDVLNPGVGTDKTGTFRITNINQAACEGWEVKVRLTNSKGTTIKTLRPTTKATCP